MMGQVGGKEPFEDGRKDLELLAGLGISTKAVERVAEAEGEQIEQQNQREQKQIFGGKVVPFLGRTTIPKLHVEIDASGVPVVPRETEGRKGKDETGRSRTREAKLGFVSLRRRRTRRGTRYGMRHPPPMWGRSRRRRRGLQRARRRSSSWPTERNRSGVSPRSIFRERPRLSISIMRESIWRRWPSYCMELTPHSLRNGLPLAATNWMRETWRRSLPP